MRNLTHRQQEILNLLARKKNLASSEILKNLLEGRHDVTQVTVNRDLVKLGKLNFLEKIGKGRAIKYKISDYYKLFEPVDLDLYFETLTDRRTGRKKFNLQIFKLLKSASLFTKEEVKKLQEFQKKYQQNLKNLPQHLIQKELERLTIELSWKSSQIEGNTYSLLETEMLIKKNQEFKNHTPEETQMILNHKAALDFILNNPQKFKTLSIFKIQQIHDLLIKDLKVSKGLRKRLVAITGTTYKPLGNQFQIREALEKLCTLINQKKDVFEKALLAVSLISYIQPFEDGNKRTGRLLANGILLAHDFCPLSYRSVDDLEYKKAILLFYEQNNLSEFKRLFFEQCAFASAEYFV